MEDPQSSQDGPRKSKFTYRHLNALSSSTPPKENPLRCVVLIDLDCFYAQVEQVRLGIPKDEPLAVQQWQGLIAINYPARKFGLSRMISPTEARKLCPNIHLAHVQTWKEGDDEPHYHPDPKVKTHKVSLDPYRRASLKILAIFRQYCDRIEKASIDESFLDMSSVVKEKLIERYPELGLPPPYNDMSYALPAAPSVIFSEELGGIVPLSEGEGEEDPIDWDDVIMFLAAEIIKECRKEVETKLGYTCSAGIARNKMLAKLAAGWKKPNQQTILRNRAVMGFLKDFKFTKIRNLGGKFGAEVASVFDTDQVSDILKISADQLRAKLGQEQGSWVYNACRGIDYTEVNPRTKIKSMLSAKNFQPALNTSESAARWLRILTADLASRVMEDEDHRVPKTITIHHRHGGTTKSRQAPLPPTKEVTKQYLYNHALHVWKGIETEGRAFPANNISVAISGFGDVEDGIQGIQGFLVPGQHMSPPSSTHPDITVNVNVPESLGKRKRDDAGIARFFGKKDEMSREMGGVQESNLSPVNEETDVDTFVCPKCQKRIPVFETEIHDDFHLALELSKASPEQSVNASSATGSNSKGIVKEEKKVVKKKVKSVEKGQKKLEFGVK